MKFGEEKVSEAEGAILAHAVKGADGRIAKGTALGEEHVSSLATAGVKAVTVARLEDGEVGEDDAAGRVAAALAGENLRAGDAVNGRANLFAESAGLFRVDEDRVAELNAVDPALTLATLRDREHVAQGRLVATVKVIPFAAREESIRRWEEGGSPLRVAAYLENKVAMIQTRLPTLKERALDKTAEVTKRRLEQCNSTLAGESRCEHDAEALAEEIGKALELSPDILLISGASAVCDSRDVLPAAISASGGEVRCVGMPVDPGNLLVLGRIGEAAVIGIPGCARSPKPNGFDWVLRRLCAGECVTAEDVSGMGVGGLLEETHERRQLRVAQQGECAGQVAAVLLAAGLSSRMEGRNKLLEAWRGKPLVRHAAETIAAARDAGVIGSFVVVTGNDRERIEETLSDLGPAFAHNEDYRSGMASSLATGIRALGDGVSAAFVCLGDMPSVTVRLLEKMAGSVAFSEGRDIVVPACGPRRGHPVLFGSRHFADLSALEGDVGARSVLARNEGSVVEIDAGDEALLDLDDEEAFRRAA